jgi:hypothetical protein
VPGFVDAHVHAWEGQLRGAGPTLDFGGYLRFTAFGYGPHYRPHGNYVGTLATALIALDAGTTTIVGTGLTPSGAGCARRGGGQGAGPSPVPVIWVLVCSRIPVAPAGRGPTDAQTRTSPSWPPMTA